MRPPRSTDLCDLPGEIRGETDLAYRFFDGDAVAWLPKSQCEWDADAKTMTLPQWLAEEKDLV